jgi:HEAT repeat protein
MDQLIDILFQDRDPAERRQAVAELGQVHDKRAIEPLILALQDSDLEVRRLAALALGKIGDTGAIPALQAAFEANNTPDVFLAISIALSELGVPETLVSALASESGWLRQNIVQALLRYKDGRAGICLINALPNATGGLAYWVGRALGELGDDRAIPSLVTLLTNSDIDVRTAAADSLGKLGSPEALQALEQMRRDDHEKNFWGRTAGQAAGMAIKTIKERSE